jgi:hypothetical protein
MEKDEDDEKKNEKLGFLELHLLKTVGNPDYIISSERTQSLPRLDDQQPHFSCVDSLLDTRLGIECSASSMPQSMRK